MRINILLTLLICITAPLCAQHTDSYTQGIDHYLNLRFSEAYTSFIKAAKNKHAEAHTMLGQLYLRGEHVPQSLFRADSVATLAIALGDAKGHYIRGMVKLTDDYPNQAEEHFVQAIPAIELAAKDNVFWLIRLGYCHSEGLGVDVNNVLARELYAKAGDAANALNNLGVMLMEGSGGPTDLEKSLTYFRRAVVKGYALSCPGIYDIGQRYKGDGETWTSDNTKAIALLKESGACGYGYAYTTLALNEEDEATRIDLFEKAVDTGDPKAALILALYNEQEKKDTLKAKSYYVKALALGEDSGEAHIALASLYQKGFMKMSRNEEHAQVHYYHGLLQKGGLPEAAEYPTIEIDAVAPFIELPNEWGKSIKLSDYRGKYVLLDFWASWCGPCRAETPYIHDLYTKYNSKGFVVLSVSIDQNKESWQKAVIKDDMIWPNLIDNTGRVSLWYQFEGIPFNLLLDKEGRIIDGNLRGAELDQAVSRLME